MKKKGPIQRAAEERQAVADLERRLGVSEGFLHALREDGNDWSFVVRIQVFVEGALAHAIVTSLGRPELKSFVDSMHLNAQHGLARLALTLGLVSKDERKLLETLSKVRNAFAHDLRNVDRGLAAYVHSLNDDEFSDLFVALVTIATKPRRVEINDLRATLGTVIRDLLWMHVMYLTIGLHFAIAKAESKSVRRAIATAVGPNIAETGLLSLNDLMKMDIPAAPVATTRAGEER